MNKIIKFTLILLSFSISGFADTESEGPRGPVTGGIIGTPFIGGISAIPVLLPFNNRALDLSCYFTDSSDQFKVYTLKSNRGESTKPFDLLVGDDLYNYSNAGKSKGDLKASYQSCSGYAFHLVSNREKHPGVGVGQLITSHGLGSLVCLNNDSQNNETSRYEIIRRSYTSSGLEGGEFLARQYEKGKLIWQRNLNCESISLGVPGYWF